MEKYLNERLLITIIPTLIGWMIFNHIFPLVESGRDIGLSEIILGSIGIIGPVLAMGYFFLTSERNWILNMIAFFVVSISFMASAQLIIINEFISVLLLGLSVLIPIFFITDKK